MVAANNEGLAMPGALAHYMLKLLRNIAREKGNSLFAWNLAMFTNILKYEAIYDNIQQYLAISSNVWQNQILSK